MQTKAYKRPEWSDKYNVEESIQRSLLEQRLDILKRRYDVLHDEYTKLYNAILTEKDVFVLQDVDGMNRYFKGEEVDAHLYRSEIINNGGYNADDA